MCIGPYSGKAFLYNLRYLGMVSEPLFSLTGSSSLHTIQLMLWTYESLHNLLKINRTGAKIVSRQISSLVHCPYFSTSSYLCFQLTEVTNPRPFSLSYTAVVFPVFMPLQKFTSTIQNL
jgi:hypothetical protein